MKKIALIHFTYPPHVGGVQVLMKQHAYILSDLGFDVTIVTGLGEEKNPKIKLIVIPELESVLKFNPSLQEKILDKGIIDGEFYQLATLIEQKLEKILKDKEIVVVHNMLTLVYNLPFVYAFRNLVNKYPNKKYFGWIHDHSYIYEFKIENLDTAVHSELEKELLTTPIKNLAYIVISESFRDPFSQLMKLPKEKIIVIPNAIDIKRFLEIDSWLWEIIDKHQLLKRFPIVLSPANIQIRKNVDYSLEIIFELKKTYPQIVYLITGRPSTSRQSVEYFYLIKKRVNDLNLKDNVILFIDLFEQPLTQSQIHDLYQIVDMIFYFSKNESFGIPLIEAALTKTPIFVSNLKVFREIGGELLEYVDYQTTSPKQAANIIKGFIEKNSRIKLNYRARSFYDLKNILKEKFISLL